MESDPESELDPDTDPDPGTGASPVMAVACAVAEHEGCEPEALRPPLAEVVDPGALDTLVRNDARVSFRYLGYDVVVEAERVAVIDPERG